MLCTRLPICHHLPMDDSPPASPHSRLAPDADDARFVRRVLILLVAAGVTVAVLRASDLLILAFGSILGAIVIHAIADLYAARLKVPAGPALGLGMATMLALLGFLAWLFAVAFRDQVALLVTEGPAIVARFAQQMSASPVGAKIVSAVKAAYAGSQAARDIGGLVRGGGEIALNFLILLFGAFFFAANPAVYERGFLLLIPPPKRVAAEDALFDVGSTLKLWLRAQLIQMTTMGVLVGLGLWIAGVPSAPALGLLTGLSEFIPYVGPIAAMVPALGLAATQGSNPVLWVLAVFVGVRIVQSNLITPFVTSSVISIPPAVTLFTIIGIGYVFGLFGLFFSAALLVVIFTLVRSVYLREVLGEPIPLSPHEPLPLAARDSR
ncbi:AI-2E family transporter [Sphingomonas bacterium]|uniref:AI-2E family transporter n=1 Tax=Sphingomonas bacterium TaxID=1895847 RepID=UPI0034A091DD